MKEEQLENRYDGEKRLQNGYGGATELVRSDTILKMAEKGERNANHSKKG
ncbi:hypothetical protein A2U01_0065751, partial [Trifolium medium]|nr:hypothetical protein [Trifolium medium]